MVPPKTIVLPSISPLPVTDRGFRRAIDDVALIAGGLIGSVDAAMLAVALPSDRWGDGPPLVAWSQRLAASPILARTLLETPMFAPAFDALCLAADAAFARLETWRWSDIDAPGLCLVTDGIGLVVSTERPPAEAGCGWLLDLVRSERGAMTVLPLRDGGVWSLIAAVAGTIH